MSQRKKAARRIQKATGARYTTCLRALDDARRTLPKLADAEAYATELLLEPLRNEEAQLTAARDVW